MMNILNNNELEINPTLFVGFHSSHCILSTQQFSHTLVVKL